MFEEKQKFPLWIYLLTLLPFIITLIGFFKFEKNSTEFGGFAFVLLIMLLVNIFIYYATLTTKIDTKGIHLKFPPFTNKKVSWENIKSAEVIKYSFVGYGWRLSFKYGRVYNTSGNKGLFVVTKNKRKILIGTQQPEKLEKIINSYVSK